MIALPTPPGSGGSFASASASRSTRSASALICSSSSCGGPGRFDVMSARDRSSRSVMCAAHLAVEPAHGAVGPLLAVLVRAQVVLDEEADRLALVAREREPRAASCRTSARRPRRDRGSGRPRSVNVRVGTLPMSWSSAAQRTSGRRTVCRTTCLVCAQTSLCWRPVSWTRSTVASSSGNSTRQDAGRRAATRARRRRRGPSASARSRRAAGPCRRRRAGGVLLRERR